MMRISRFLIGLLCVILSILTGSCGKQPASSDTGAADKAELPVYQKVLGGTVPLAAENYLTHETENFSYTEDCAVTYDDSVQKPVESKNMLGYPRVNVSKYEKDEIFIYNHNVMDFGAKADGVQDDTGAIQNALNRAKITGGTVYIPAGVYRLDGALYVPHGVTLRGDFCSPDYDQAPGNGTVLHVYHGKNTPNSSAAVTLGVGSALVGMTIYYPEQDYKNIVPYPHTVSISHSDGAYEADCATIQDIWFVNSYAIADLGLEKNSGIHYVKNVYGSPLYRGLEMDKCYDVGRVEQVFFSPSYLLKAEEKNISAGLTAELYQAACRQMYRQCIGMVINKSDWEYIYSYNADSLNTAVLLTQRKSGASNCQFSHMTISDCKFGMKFEYVNTIGMSVANSYFDCSSDPEAVAVLTTASIRSGINKFNNCTFSAESSKAVLIQNAMEFSFVNCRFRVGEKGVGVSNTGNCTLQVLQCDFTGKGTPVDISEKVKRLQLLGCSFEQKDKISVKKSNALSVKIDHTPLGLPVQSGYAHRYKKTLPRPKTNHVYYLLSYGAKINTDCTKALKKALADAAKTGGTVYVPTGTYLLTDSITVPSGVELRGSQDNQFHPKDFIGTVFIADVAAGEEQGALIRLSENSGVAGFSVYYKNQFSGQKVTPYDWTIQSLGKGVWAKNICLMNSYKGIDFATYPSDDYYLHFISGAPIKTGIFVGSNSTNGWMENCQFNSHYNTKSKAYQKIGCDKNYHMEKRLENAVSFLFGSHKSAHILGNFSYGTKIGAHFIEQAQGKFNGSIIGLGIDNSEFSVDIENAGYVEFVNSQFTIIRQTNDMKYIRIHADNTGTVKFFNAELYGHSVKQQTPVLVIDGKGQVDIQGFYIMAGSDFLYDLRGGKISVTASIFDLTKLAVRCHDSVESANFIANSCTPSVLGELKPGDPLLSIDNHAGKRFNILNSILR